MDAKQIQAKLSVYEEMQVRPAQRRAEELRQKLPELFTRYLAVIEKETDARTRKASTERLTATLGELSSLYAEQQQEEAKLIAMCEIARLAGVNGQ